MNDKSNGNGKTAPPIPKPNLAAHPIMKEAGNAAIQQLVNGIDLQCAAKSFKQVPEIVTTEMTGTKFDGIAVGKTEYTPPDNVTPKDIGSSDVIASAIMHSFLELGKEFPITNPSGSPARKVLIGQGINVKPLVANGKVFVEVRVAYRLSFLRLAKPTTKRF